MPRVAPPRRYPGSMPNISTTPKVVVPNDRTEGMWGVLGLCVSWQFLLGGPFICTSEPHPIPPFFPAPPGGHERHNPLRGRERDWPEPGVTPGFMAESPWDSRRGERGNARALSVKPHPSPPHPFCVHLRHLRTTFPHSRASASGVSLVCVAGPFLEFHFTGSSRASLRELLCR